MLKSGTEYLLASTVRRVVQVASMSIVGSAIAVSRLDKEVRRVTTTYPEEDPITLADHMVRMCEEEVLDWMRTRTVHPGPDADPDPAGSPTGQELVDDLEKALAEEEVERYSPAGLQRGRMDDEGTGSGYQGALLRGGDHKGLATLRLPVVLVADGSGSESPLCPLWGPRGGRGQGEGPEDGQGVDGKGR
jgi:hypothetical protein